MTARRRHAARVIVLDDEERVLLLHTCDPARPGLQWLELPGGRIEGDEPAEDAARRELYEETGLAVTRLGASVATVDAEFEFDGRKHVQRESIFVVRVPRFEPTLTAPEDERERAAHLGHRWWRADDGIPDGVRLHPPELPQLLKGLLWTS